jgi:hypothetical protein
MNTSITMGTLFHIAKEYGWSEESDRDEMEDVYEFLTLTYNFRYNVISSKIEIKKNGDTKYIVIDDMLLNSMWIEANRRYKLKTSPQTIHKMLYSDLAPRFTIEDYLDRLSWSGHNHIGDWSKLLRTKLQILECTWSVGLLSC